MRDYQKQKNNKYILPRTVYNQTLWRIRDYHRLKEQANDILNESPCSKLDGLPKGCNLSDSSASKAIKRDKYLSEIKVIDNALLCVPTEYRKGVWQSIMYGKAYPLDADRSTYSRYKSKFVFNVAESMHLI